VNKKKNFAAMINFLIGIIYRQEDIINSFFERLEFERPLDLSLLLTLVVIIVIIIIIMYSSRILVILRVVTQLIKF
jgi:hypothetical protein